MNKRRILAAAAVALMASASAGSVLATGDWLGGGGEFEPSTVYDKYPGYMFQARNTEAVEKLYFNAYFLHYAGFRVGAFFDPNLDGGSVMSPYTNYAVGLLGLWRDCNGDGYIGAKILPSAYGSFSSYTTDLNGVLYAINESICPKGSAYWPTNPFTGQPSKVIDEFRWVGPEAGCDRYEAGCPGAPTAPPPNPVCVPPNPNTPVVGPMRQCVPPPDAGRTLPGDTNGINDITDNRSRVWGDWERPGFPHVPYGPLNPLPRGTFSDLHGTLRFVDDATLRTLSNTVPGWSTIPNFGECAQPHPVFLGGSSGTCGLYPLWQVRRVFNDTTCTSAESTAGQQNPGCWEPDPIVYTWDLETDDNGDGTPCNDGAYQTVPNPQDNSLLVRLALPDARPRLNPNFLADGSLSGQVEHVSRGLNATAVFPGLNNQGTGQCDGDQEQLNDFLFEIDTPDSVVKHVEPSMIFNFTADIRSHRLAQAGYYDLALYEYGNLGGGVGGGQVFSAPGWYTNVLWTARPPRHGWGYITPTYATFYADVTPQVFANNQGANPLTALPATRTDAWIYGTEFCPGFTTGAPAVSPVTKWECSITQWEATRLQFPTSDPGRFGAIIGDPYDLRDVDCFDNTISEHNGVTGAALDGQHLGIVDCGAVDA